MLNQTSKGPKVIASIREFLSEASEDNPTTKEEILEKLRARFPKRDATKMMSTVKQQVPNKLRVAGYPVRKNNRGYWLPRQEGYSLADTPLPRPQRHPPQTIRIDPEVWQALQKLAVPFVETPNDVLRRLLGLPPT